MWWEKPHMVQCVFVLPVRKHLCIETPRQICPSFPCPTSETPAQVHPEWWAIGNGPSAKQSFCKLSAYSHVFSSGKENYGKEAHLCAFVSPILVHSVSRSPRGIFLLDAQVSIQNLKFVVTRLLSPGLRAICFSSWVASTAVYYNQDQLCIYFWQRTATSDSLLCLFRQWLRQLWFLCPKKKRNSYKINRKIFNRGDLLEIVLLQHRRSTLHGQNFSLKS